MRSISIGRWQWAKISMLHGAAFTLVAFVLAFAYLPYIKVFTPLGFGYLATAFIGQIGLLCLLFTLLNVVLTFILKHAWAAALTAWLISSSGLLLLFADTQVYDLYRFHLGAFVWSLVFGEGASQVIDVSWYTAFISGAKLLTILAVNGVLLWWSISTTLKGKLKGIRWTYSSLILLCFAGANGLHAWHDAHGNSELGAMTRHLPLYQPATAIDYFADQGWIDPATVVKKPTLTTEASNSLNYPEQGYAISADNKPNILFLAIDAWRGDTFDAETMPYTYGLTARDDAQWFTDHHSGGNVTKGGIFSLFYALPPTYWDSFTALQRPPVFIRSLQQADYRMGIYGSSTLINPTFHRNVFSSVPEMRKDTPGDTAYQRDAQITQDFMAFTQPQSAPFFSFLFYDAAHGYAPPPDFEPKFQPYWDRVDHVALGPDFDPAPYKNRYRTALRYIDTQIEQVISHLKDTQQLDNTIVVITSDHGEEFNETGKNYWGHGSNFSRHQTHVPLLILWPNKVRKTFTARTSHYDLVPTLMEEGLGIDTPMSDYSTGQSLFAVDKKSWLLIHSYFNYGLVLDDRIVTTYPTGNYEVSDLELNPSDKALPAPVSLDVLNDITRFYAD